MVAVVEQRGVVLGRYVLYDEIAIGGMASVHLARLMGPVGFSRTVAIKRLHRHLANDEAFLSMFLDEARLAARIRHPNVVPTLDVVTVEQELFLVMEYVQGESLSKLQRAARATNETVPVRIASAILVASLHGLHAAHEAKSESGEPLGIVHRDVSPQNILVGADGVVRVLDFGIAKAMGRLHTTRDGQVKGKAGYMAPEQLRGAEVDPRTDVYSASVVLWEVLTGQRLFAGDSPEATMNMVLERVAPPPSTLNADVPAALDALVLRGLSRDARKRFASAREMAIALESVVAPATSHEIGQWVERTAGEVLRRRARIVADIESQPSLRDDSSTPSPSNVSPSSVESVVRAPLPARATLEAPGPSRPSRPGALTYLAFGVAAVAVAVACWTVVTFRPAAMPALAPSAVASLPAAGASAAGTSAAGASASASASASAMESAAIAEGPTSLPTKAAASPTLADGRRSPVVGRPAAVSPVRKAPPRATSTSATSTSPTSRKCDPPYVIDANGDRSPKPECL